MRIRMNRSLPLACGGLLALATVQAAPGDVPALDDDGVPFAAASADVGDPASFGRNLRWLGLLQTGTLSLRSDCTPPPGTTPGPDDRCIVLNPPPAVTSFDEPDLGRITLPGKSARSLICQWVTPYINYSFFNPTGVMQPFAQFRVTPTLRIESEVLNDPALIDPGTGLPLGGAIESGLTGTFFRQRSLDPGENEFQFINFSRVCIGGIVSENFLSGYGLTNGQIRQLFKKPITLRVGISGSAALIDDASVLYGLRLVGD